MKNLLFFVAIFTFAGCNNEQNEYKYSLIPSNEIVFKLNYESSNAPAPYSDFKTEDTVLLAVWNNRNRSVEIYNLNLCRLVNEIQIPSTSGFVCQVLISHLSGSLPDNLSTAKAGHLNFSS